MNLHQIADRIRSGNPLVIGDAVYSMTRVRERAEQNADYQAAMEAVRTEADPKAQMQAREQVQRIWYATLYEEAADALADYRAFPQFLMEQAA